MVNLSPSLPLQLLRHVASAFACSPSSRIIRPPPLPVRAFGAEVNYLQALIHHAVRANAAAAASAADADDARLPSGDSAAHSSIGNAPTCISLLDDGPTSIYRGGWFKSPSLAPAAASSSLVSPAALSPLDFWYTLPDASPGDGYPSAPHTASNVASSRATSKAGSSGGFEDELGLMGHKQSIASFLLQPSRRLDLLTRAATASVGLQVAQRAFI